MFLLHHIATGAFFWPRRQPSLAILTVVAGKLLASARSHQGTDCTPFPVRRGTLPCLKLIKRDLLDC
jgi:hypothetical protein